MALVLNVVRADRRKITNLVLTRAFNRIYNKECPFTTAGVNRFLPLLCRNVHSCTAVKSLYSTDPFSRRDFHSSHHLCDIVPFTLSDIGEGITEVSVKEWFVKVGDKVAQFDNICEVQSDKASVTITSRYDGVISKLYYAVDDTAKVGLPLVDIEVEGESSVSSSNVAEKTPSYDDGDNRENQVYHSSEKALATPAVRRIAGENKVDLSSVKGTGKGGRVMKEDILAYIAGNSTSKKSIPSARPPIITAPMIPSTASGDDRIVPITGYTKTMVKTMTAANSVPHFVYSDELDVGPLIQLRKQMKPAVEKHDIKLTYMPFFLKAISLALYHFPILNASVNSECTEVIYKSRHNIGFAMDTSNGLVVPNIKDVQSLRLLDIASETNRLIEAGKTGTLLPKDVTGGTFSLSNIGSIGGTYMKPVLLIPEVAIGALGKIQRLPRYGKSGAIEESHIMCVSWAADHRVIDGATVARFSNMFKELIENPIELVIH
ncbi:lipoamide acyltransferase component of branched-chain alpha-keto acid dehydrogenase complex, mitochondrial isoform X1 [Frankliniella occidentalis]|uniref:Dihydrolipoamide acetyltransferase component of pyruvate dehydrogenase complex n=1 Tax=Frankliniella occidentalis TaxID=133901 RepID=A0A9C6U5H9_FRAOC|nr:lipoamide acyltransferase component of branched-chain alpha-keto acid dehydrogenase complex, mitochondrial isoform X1 [Frankliniella occidentalis]